MVRITGFVECRSQKNCRRVPHGDLRHNYEIENLLTSFLYGSFLEGLDEQTPEGLCCGDVGTLDGGVRAAQGGTEAHDIHVRVFAQDDGALETCVVNLYDALLVEELLVQVEQHVQGLAVGVGIPADVVTAGLYLEASQVEAGHQHLDDVVLHVLTG